MLIRTLMSYLFVICLIGSASASDMADRDGFEVYPTAKPFETLVKDTRDAVKSNGLIVVTQAGPTKAAASRGIDIPGNLVIGAADDHCVIGL